MMDRWRAEISVGEDDQVVIMTDLRKADSCLHEPILGAIAAHLGWEMGPMLKASTVKAPDPRYPELTTLIRAARNNWDEHGKDLVHRLLKMLGEGKLLPMTPANEAVLQELFRDHHVRVTVGFAGTTSDKRRMAHLIKEGLITQDLADRAPIPLSYRMGRGLRMLQVHHPSQHVHPPLLTTVIRKALDVELTPQDRDALAYSQKRAATYMRRPAEVYTSEVERLLTEEEKGTIRATVAGAVRDNVGGKKLEQRLRDAVTTPSLQNDMQRVAVTELAFAHSYGAYQALKQQAARAGEADPLVYKFVAPGACHDCKRIWGPPSSPHKYKLSHVEEREAAGGNFRRPRRDWGPVIGPVHPRCTEGPLQYWDETLVNAINEAADEMDALFGR